MNVRVNGYAPENEKHQSVNGYAPESANNKTTNIQKWTDMLRKSDIFRPPKIGWTGMLRKKVPLTGYAPEFGLFCISLLCFHPIWSLFMGQTDMKTWFLNGQLSVWNWNVSILKWVGMLRNM